MEVPSLLMALYNTNNESYSLPDSSIVLTWIQGPSNRWKTFVGNRVATIQEETASATRRHVPSQSNPADLISRGVKPATLSTSTPCGRDHNGLYRSHPAGLQQRSTLPQKIWKSEMHMLHFDNLQKTSHKDSPIWTNSSELLHTAEELSTTAGILRPTGYQLYPHKFLTRHWLAVWRSYNKFLMHKKWRNWRNNKGLQPPVLKILHSNNFMKATTCFSLHNMLQSSSLMARVQDLLATEGRDWRFIPLRGPRFRGLGSSSNIHDVPSEENTGFSHCYLTKKLPHYLLR